MLYSHAMGKIKTPSKTVQAKKTASQTAQKKVTGKKSPATKTAKAAKPTSSVKKTATKKATAKVSAKKIAARVSVKKVTVTAPKKTAAKKTTVKATKVSSTKAKTTRGKTTDKASRKLTKTTPSKKPMRFRLNQKIVYPSQGVGKITEISEQLFKDEQLLYYKIYIEASDMLVMVPVARAQELGIRAIVSATEAEKALKLLSEDFEPITSDWKLRYQMNLDLLKKGSILDIATIVRCLYNRSKVKELPILERKLYDSARKLLEDEISFALGKPAKEVEAMIHTKLEPPGSMPKVKHTISIDDDEDDNLMDDMNDEADSDDSSNSYDDDSF